VRALVPAVLASLVAACGADHAVGPDAAPASDGAAEPGPDAAPMDPTFSVVVLPDTQFYAAYYPKIFEAQTRWILAQKDALKIAFVLHLGDIVNNEPVEAQWQLAAMDLHALDGKVPYVLAAGNHDVSTATREGALLNKYFPVAQFMRNPWFGGTFQPNHIENSWQLFQVGGRWWLVLSLEFGPRDEVLSWAADLLASHADTTAIVVTHAYLYRDDERYDWARFGDKQAFNPHWYGLPGTTNDGEEMWRKLIAPHDNVRLVLSGHVTYQGATAARTTDVRPSGTHAHQVLSNYQYCIDINLAQSPCVDGMGKDLEGGGGFLRIMQFDEANHRLQVRTYSPYYDRFMTDPANEFVLDLDR
jgi:hypothetical protein